MDQHKNRTPIHPSEKPGLLGILLVNLGTPDSPSVSDVRRYLAEFLGDPRVIHSPRLLWWFILHGTILRTRPRHSAAAYARIWTDEGSPLLQIARHQADTLQQHLNDCTERPVRVELAMRYGNPSIPAGLKQLRQVNAQQIIVLPLFPQYSATTTASVFDAVSRELQQWCWIPELGFINHYQDDPSYIEALAASVRDFWDQNGEPEQLLISFHGIPEEYAEAGDPYPEGCRTSARLLASELGLKKDRWALSFQSRMGRREWIKPYTDETLREWGQRGVKNVHVICPGFSADCLETLEEIAIENRDCFLGAGGEEYRYIPALNATPAHIEALAELLLRHVHERQKVVPPPA